MSTQAFRGLSFVEIVEKLQEDDEFSRDFEALAQIVVDSGSNLDSPAGRRLLMHFAKNEGELAELLAAKDVLRNVLARNRRNTVDTATGTFTGGSVVCG